MAKRIEIAGNGLIVTDTVSGLIEVSQPSKELWYNESKLQSGIVRFESIRFLSNAQEHELYPEFSLSEAVDSEDVSFTESTFREFCEDNLGKYSGGGSGQGAVNGFLDYNDTATSITPISITGGAGYVHLTNNELGAFTNKNYPPQGVTDVWDSINGEFDFTQLILGSKLDIRTDLNITTTSPNTDVELAMELAIGGSAYDLVIDTEAYKSTGTYSNQTFYNWIYMGDTNTLNNPAKLKIKADNDIDVVVNGWACYINLY